MPQALTQLLTAECRQRLQKLGPALREDIYALSLYTDTGDTTAPELVLSFNTRTRITQALAGQTGGFGLPADENEAKWNFAFWLQTPNVRLLTPPESRDGILWQELLSERGGSYSEADDFDIESFESSVTQLLNEVGVAAARAMHGTGLIREIFGRDIPIIIHNLEYDDETAERTAAANPPNLTTEFGKWVREE